MNIPGKWRWNTLSVFQKGRAWGTTLYSLYRPKASESTLSDGNLQNLIQFEQFAPLQCMECMDKYSRCFCQEALRLASQFPQARASPFQASPAFGEWISPLFFQICPIYAAALGGHSLDLRKLRKSQTKMEEFDMIYIWSQMKRVNLLTMLKRNFCNYSTIHLIISDLT